MDRVKDVGDELGHGLLFQKAKMRTKGDLTLGLLASTPPDTSWALLEAAPSDRMSVGDGCRTTWLLSQFQPWAAVRTSLKL